MAKKKKENGLPDVLFVSRMDDGEDGTYLVAYEESMECIDGDNPTFVGTYELVATQKLARVVKEVE